MKGRTGKIIVSCWLPVETYNALLQYARDNGFVTKRGISPGKVKPASALAALVCSALDESDDATQEVVNDASCTDQCFIHNDVFDVYAPVLGSIGIAIYGALCSHISKHPSHPISYTKLAEKAGCSRQAAIEAVDLLCQCRMISKKAVSQEVQ